MHHRGALVASSFALLGALAGCLERTETLIVRPDGALRAELRFETGSFDDLYAIDAVPRLEGGWLVVEESGQKPDGDEFFRLTAEAEFLADEALPSTYELPNDSLPGTALEFPTTLDIEERDGGTYYHFRRVYTARPWAYIETERAILREQLDKLAGREPWTLASAERHVLITSYLRLELLETRAFCLAAMRDVTPDAPQDGWLRVRAALEAQLDTIDYERVSAMFGTEENPEVDGEALTVEMAAFENAMAAALERLVREEAGYTWPQRNTFLDRLAWHKRFYDVTEDLGDDAFTVTVQMPGTIIAHNAETASSSAATWKLSGELFRDRDYELMVTSRVAR